MSKIYALIDADLLIYRAAYHAETSVSWDADTYTVQANLKQAKEEFDARVEAIIHLTNADEAKLAISCTWEDNFRRDFWPSYKEPRVNPGKRSAKPLLYREMREHARLRYNAVELPRMEADDVLGIMATRGGVRYMARVICSIDKDLKTIPGLHFDWRTPQLGVHEVKELDARRAFYTQVLTGDKTDNYPGLPGCGPIKAERVLQGAETPSDFWHAVTEAYFKKGLTEQDALLQARCARILRACDYDFDTKAIRLWTPMRGET